MTKPRVSTINNDNDDSSKLSNSFYKMDIDMSKKATAYAEEAQAMAKAKAVSLKDSSAEVAAAKAETRSIFRRCTRQCYHHSIKKQRLLRQL
jgi:hypothetical protein